MMNVVDLWRRSFLRRAAQRYAYRGWRVIPGAFLISDRYACGPLCHTVACHPAVDRWERLASSDSAAVQRWWARNPYSVLLATGHSFDVIEVPATLGVAAVQRERLGPVAVTPAGRWMFLVAPGEGLRPELASRLDVVLHGLGSWIPAPPTRTPVGRVRWVVPPDAAERSLPHPYSVQKLLVSQMRSIGPVPTFASSTPALSRAA